MQGELCGGLTTIRLTALSCRIMLESFVNTQKLSVQKALRRKFKRFIVTKGDFDQLVLFKLQVGVPVCCCECM